MRIYRISLLCAVAASAETPYEIQKRSIALQTSAQDAMQESLSRQIAAVRKQANLPPGTPRTFLVMSQPEPPALPEFACDALSPMRSAVLVTKASQSSGVSADLLNAVIQQESGFRPCALSSKGAQGLMQLMPATAERFGVSDAFDPEQNILAGANLLKQLMERYSGDLSRVLSAYNAGTSRVDAVAGVPFIPETMNYVQKILGGLTASPPALN